VVKSGEPLGLAINTEGSYEEHHLANAVIEYFSRPETEMDATQKAALDKYRELADDVNLKDVLNSNDPRPQLSLDTTEKLFGVLNNIFFAGSLMHIDFSWSTKFNEWKEHKYDPPSDIPLAHTAIREIDGREFHGIQIHPTKISASIRYIKQCNISRSEDRLGSVLHELIHAFVFQHTCKFCVVQMRYLGAGHGRGFQLIAKAVEEKELEFLGTKVRIGRLQGIMTDMEEPLGMNLLIRSDSRPRGPSAHDMEVYGFLEPL
jgi:hypothetical protein